MLTFILTSIYFGLPVIVANSAPVFIKPYLGFLTKPVDGGKLWREKPILGSHKTWRGFIVGILFGIIVVYIQQLLYKYDFFKNISYVDYKTINVIFIGFLFGFGALFGDAIKSFIKRRFGIKSGDKFFPWDQLDSLIGAGILISFVISISWKMWLFYIIFALIIHPLLNFIGYKIGLKEVPW